MKKGIVRGAILLIAGLLLSFAPQVRGDATVYWDFDNGFSPGTVIIGPGDAVTWWNVDPYGFDVQVTFNNSFSFSLPNGYGQPVTFPSQPGIYGYHSNWGENGAVRHRRTMRSCRLQRRSPFKPPHLIHQTILCPTSNSFSARAMPPTPSRTFSARLTARR